jgi:hypothetical protein
MPGMIHRSYKAVAKYSIDTGNPIEQIGPEAVSHLVAFWNYLSPLFKQVYLEAAERELRTSPKFCSLDINAQKAYLESKWMDYVQKHKILDSPHSWVLDNEPEKQKK